MSTPLTKKWRAALVGCGRIGADCGTPGTGSSRILSHAHALSSLPEVDFVALCDTDTRQLERAAARWPGPAAYTELEELLDKEKPELVCLANATAHRWNALQQILSKDGIKGVLIEKPICASGETLQSLDGIEKTREPILAVNYTRRFCPAYQRAAAMIRQGALGSIQHVQAYYTKGLLNNASHALDLLRLFFGEPEFFTNIRTPAWAVTEANDPTLTFSAVFGSFEARVTGLDAAAHNCFDIDIIGTQGRLRIDDQGHRMHLTQLQNTEAQHGFNQLDPQSKTTATELQLGIRFAVQNLLECCRTQSQPLCSFADGLRAYEYTQHILSETSRADAEHSGALRNG